MSIVLVFFVALSETEGKSLSTGLETPCEVMKNYLLGKISGVEAEQIRMEKEETDVEIKPTETDSDIFINEDEQHPPKLKQWIDDIEMMQKTKSSTTVIGIT